MTKMPRRTWEERKDSKDEQTKSLGRLSTHVTSEDEQGKKEKQQSKTKQEKGKSNGLPWDLIKGFWGIIKSRIVTSTPTTIIFIIVISWKSAVLNIAPRRHICKRSARQTLQAFNLKLHKQTNFNYDVIIILQKVLSFSFIFFFSPQAATRLLTKWERKKLNYFIYHSFYNSAIKFSYIAFNFLNIVEHGSHHRNKDSNFFCLGNFRIFTNPRSQTSNQFNE